MKLISLNIWEGKQFADLTAFVEKEGKDTDVFCFQEVLSSKEGRQLDIGRPDIYEQLALRLPAHRGMFFPIQEHFSEGDSIRENVTLGNAIFVRKELATSDEGFTFVRGRLNSFVNGDLETLGYGFAHLIVTRGDKRFVVVSVHGISMPGHKQDTPDRIRQSEILKKFMNEQKYPFIVAGDFNLMPETESVAMLSRGVRNLIAEFHITDTRGDVSHRRFPDNPQFFADFAFASPDVSVESFDVPNIPASDHLPLILRFSLP